MDNGMELKNVNRHYVKPLGDRQDSSDDGDVLANPIHSLDKEDMERMGKQQQFKRNFRLSTNLAFVALAMGTWEVVLSATAGGILNGGSGGLIWTYVGSFFAFGTIVLSLAEMASMAPTAGGQYHWASEFAPRAYQKPISYLSGWLSMLSWQCGTASGMYLEGAEIQAVIALVHPNYTAPPYQAYLMMVGIVSIGAFFNIYCAKHLPMVEGIFLIGHILGFFAIVITLGVLSPTLPASEVFGSFQSESGYKSLALSIVVGQMSAVYGLIGSDGAVHMAEETENAARNVPRSITYSYLMNGILGFSMLLLYLFCLTDVQDALNSNVGLLGFPYMYMFMTGTGSVGGAAVLGSMVLVLGWAGATSFLASTSRQTFAFARDQGLPFSGWLSHVDDRHHVPTRSVMFTWGFTVLLCIIKVGSATAFNAIISLQLLALLSTYAISIGCLIYKRTRHEPMPRSMWSMGKFGLPINCIAFTYSIFVMIFCCFPSAVPVTTLNFNWAPVMFVGVLAIAGAYYVLYGRHTYEGPVMYVVS